VLRTTAPHEARALQAVEIVLDQDLGTLHHADQVRLTAALEKSRALHTAYCMRSELVALWERSAASKEQLVRHLQDWCQRAEASGIVSLAQFSRRLRSYE